MPICIPRLPEEIVAAAGFQLSDWSKKRPRKSPTFSLKQGRLTGFTDLYRKDGELMFGSIQLWYRLAEPRGRIAKRFDWAYQNGVWEWPDSYRGDDIERPLDRDCRAILLGLSEGRVLGGEQQGTFQIVLPYADDWQRVPGASDEINSGALAEINTDGLIDIRQLAFDPFPPAAVSHPAGLFGRLFSTITRT